MKKLFCDIDSTINDHWKRIRRFTINGKCDWSKALSREELLKDVPLPGAKTALEILSTDYEIHFLTARPFADAYDITKTWLDLHEFEYKSIIVVNSSLEKINYLENEPGCLFVDDLSRKHETHPPYTILYNDTILLLDKLNINYYIFDGSWDKVLYKLNKGN